jgi:hypothetical protein
MQKMSKMELRKWANQLLRENGYNIFGEKMK